MSARPQLGITAEANSSALFLTFNQSGADGALATIIALLREIPALEQSYRSAHPEAAFHVVAALGSGFWDRVHAANRPCELVPFPALENGDLVAPFTPVDLLFHIRSERKDLNFKLGREITARLGHAVMLVEQVEGFRYLDSRDLTGFVDGTENPQDAHRAEVAVIGAEDPVFAGGCYVHIQRYVHDLYHWNRQQVKVQEDIIGRTKADNIEYPSDQKAPTAHTKRTSLKDDAGNSIEILRHSMPYGDMYESGLLFASYCRTPRNFTLMLKSMIEGDGAGHTDHLLRFTRAVTGAAFFAPSQDMLAGLGG